MNSEVDAKKMEFRNLLKSSKYILAITGAGISAESGIPTFRGAGGFWRKYESTSLASPNAFQKNPSLVWEFYHYRRELCLTCQPNKGHQSLAKFEDICRKEGKQFLLITQNVDGLHIRAGSKNIIEFHGNLYKTRCTECGDIQENFDSPICEALRGRGAPDAEAEFDPIPTNQLPRCKKCSGLLRPHIVWFGETIPKDALEEAYEAADKCDLCLVAGTSSVVQPAASLPIIAADRSVPVVEFNVDVTPITYKMKYTFKGSCSETLPKLLE